MDEKYYVFTLDDPAMPGFCSFNKLYVGTEDTIKMVADNLEAEGVYPETVQAIRDYFNGNKNATHNIAYAEHKILTPVKILAENRITFNEKQWTHLNIWQWPYEMHVTASKTHQIVFKYEGKYYRCIRAWLENLSYDGINGEWKPLSSGFWGNRSILNVIFSEDKSSFVFNNLLFVIEEIYEEGPERAIEDIKKEEKLEFGRICDEIFADG